MTSDDASKTELESREKKIPYPKSVIFIIGNEFCERFCYYGMRTILVLYFKNILEYTDNRATQLYHIFSMACYFTPVLGAFIADSFLGKFWTILSLSLVYVVGNIILSFSAISGNAVLSFLALSFFALGTGGIKPCVAAFGGDQFVPGQETYLQRFFSLFYLTINLGSLCSTFITPILRQDVNCYGRNDCYPLAFGVPAILMIVAVLLFVFGRFISRYRIIPPQKDNVVFMVISCVFHALGRRITGKAGKKSHWLEYADDKYDMKTINEVKAVMGVLFLYLPLPIFWTLFDQQGSRWTLQAIRMNGKLGSFIIKPDQIQVVNPLLVVIFIPLFDYVFYPVLYKLGLRKPLRRMVVGGSLAALAFAGCGLFQLEIESEMPKALLPGHNHLAIVNGRSENLVPDLSSITDNHIVINPHKAWILPSVERAKLLGAFSNVNGTLLEEDGSLIVYYQNNTNPSLIYFPNILTKPKDSGSKLYTIFDLQNYDKQEFKVTESNDDIQVQILNQEEKNVLGYLDVFEVEIKGKSVEMSVGNHKTELPELGQGATYIQLIAGDINEQVDFTLTNIVEENQLSVFFQIIQYFLITCGEIMFSITGLEFSYSQAPKTMKSVLQAAWLLTVAVGNLIIALIADSKLFEKQSHEFFFFAALMFADMLLFAFMAYFYVPVKKFDSETSNDQMPMESMNGFNEKSSPDNVE